MESLLDVGLAFSKELMSDVLRVKMMVWMQDPHLVWTTASLTVYHLAPTMVYWREWWWGHLSQPELLAQTEEAQ